MREAAQIRGHRGDRVLFDGRVLAALTQLQPVVLKGYGVQFGPERAEGMEVPVPYPAPVRELLPQPEGAASPSHQVVFVDAEQAVQSVKRGQSHLADRSDLALRRVESREFCKNQRSWPATGWRRPTRPPHRRRRLRCPARVPGTTSLHSQGVDPQEA